MGVNLKPAQIEFLDRALESVPVFLDSLRDKSRPGRFYPCTGGLTAAGKKLSLGFSCLALKNYYILGLWDRLPDGERSQWLEAIKAFQTDESGRDPMLRNSFPDPVLVSELNSFKRRLDKFGKACRHLRTWWRNRAKANPYSDSTVAVIAETKQAISTLLQVGDRPARAYTALVSSHPDPVAYFRQLDWSTPWRAGGQAAALTVFLKVLDNGGGKAGGEIARQLSECETFFAGICDRDTGSYFTGNAPGYTQLVNGAMKVLTALAWIETGVHRPEKLIDTVLSELPEPGGCHLVDSVYVLHQCLAQVDYRKKDTQSYCLEIIDMIALHYNGDGGFSYYRGRSADTYYGVQYATGVGVSDLHGTNLLCWAIAMIAEILEPDKYALKNIKP